MDAQLQVLKKYGFSELTLTSLTLAIKAADEAIATRAKQRLTIDYERVRLRSNENFMWRKDDGGLVTVADITSTQILVSGLLEYAERTSSSSVEPFFSLTEEDMSQSPKISAVCGNKENFGRFLQAEVGASIDGIDGTLFFAFNRYSSIWFGLARYGKPCCSFFLSLAPSVKGIDEIAIAEAGKGAWILQPAKAWRRLAPNGWDGKTVPRIGHGLPLSKHPRFGDPRLVDYADYLAGDIFRGQKAQLSQIVPIGRAVIDVISGKQYLYAHGALPVWDWFPMRLFVEETGLNSLLYRLGDDGIPYLLPKGPEEEDYNPTRRLCLSFGTEEFVEISHRFLSKKAKQSFFAEAGVA